MLGAAPRFYDPADAGSTNDFYRVTSNPSLNLNDGNFTLAAWVFPTATGNAAYDAYPQGLIGYNSGDANAMPSLQRVGRGLRFGFGDSVANGGWKSVDSIDNVLTVGVWQQVAATFDGHTVSFYVNGLLKDTKIKDGKPAAGNYQLMIGRSDEKGAIQFPYAYVREEGDGSGNAELTVRFDNPVCLALLPLLL